MILDGRHYVTLGRKGRRRHLVIRTTAVPSERRGGRVALRYVVVSRHFTWKGAQKVAQRLNAREGIAQ